MRKGKREGMTEVKHITSEFFTVSQTFSGKSRSPETYKKVKNAGKIYPKECFFKMIMYLLKNN